MDGLITLADLPELGAGDSPRTTIAVARLDDNLSDPRYGKFAITQPMVDRWKRNLSETFGGRVAIDQDHSSDRPGAARSTEAAGWIVGLHQDGKLVNADVEWTSLGASAIRDKRFLYMSPTFVPDYKDEHGTGHGDALIGAAQTNRPVLRKGMPTLSLSRDDFDDVATVETDVDRRRALAREQQATVLEDSQRAAPRASDSRRRMPRPDLKQLAKFLELDDDADAAKVLAAVNEIAPAPEPTDEERKAAKKAKKQLAADAAAGAVTLSAEQVATLMSGANAGLAAQKQLADVQFKTAWEKALSEGRAAPAQEETMRKVFEKDADLAITTLDSFVAIVPVKPTGSGDGAELGTAPAGMEQDRFELHRKAQQRAKTLMAERQGLDEAEAYTLAAIEIEDAAAGVEGPVF